MPDPAQQQQQEMPRVSKRFVRFEKSTLKSVICRDCTTAVEVAEVTAGEVPAARGGRISRTFMLVGVAIRCVRCLTLG